MAQYNELPVYKACYDLLLVNQKAEDVSMQLAGWHQLF